MISKEGNLLQLKDRRQYWDMNVLANKENIWSFLCGIVFFSFTPLYNCKTRFSYHFRFRIRSRKGKLWMGRFQYLPVRAQSRPAKNSIGKRHKCQGS